MQPIMRKYTLNFLNFEYIRLIIFSSSVIFKISPVIVRTISVIVLISPVIVFPAPVGVIAGSVSLSLMCSLPG